ncbi:MAG: type II CAAX endopeptidase family protein [Leeuwenhoekiella sp.]
MQEEPNYPGKFKGWQRVLLLIVPYLITVITFQLLGFFVTQMVFDLSKESELQTTIIKCFDLLGTTVLLYVFMRFIDEEPFVNLGFHLKNHVKDIAVGLVMGLVVIGAGFLFLLAGEQIEYASMQFEWYETFVSIALFTVVAVVEEMLTRGYLLRNLMYSFNRWVALIISSAVFAFMHAANPNVSTFALIDIFLAGVMLGLPYILTKNLWLPIALHFSWNFFQSQLGFNVSGQDFYSWVETSFTESTVWNGGAFGFEGSILSIVAQVVLMLWILMYYGKMKTIFKRRSSAVIGLLILISFGLQSCAEKELTAQEIVDRAITEAGGNILKNANLDFKFRDRYYRSERENGKFVLERCTDPSCAETRDQLTNDGFVRFDQNQPVELPDSLVSQYSESVNSVHYFAVLPYGLQAPAVNKELVGTGDVNGKSYYKIKVNFQQEGGGTDFQDEYMYWISTEDFSVDYLAYNYEVNEGGTRFRVAYNPRMINGVRVVDYKNYKPIEKFPPLENLDSLYEAGALNLLSTIDLESVEVTPCPNC